MSTGGFDPYQKWLGIKAKDQPPHHYRLLGLDAFEDDPDTIEIAADKQMMVVRTLRESLAEELARAPKLHQVAARLLSQLSSSEAARSE